MSTKTLRAAALATLLCTAAGAEAPAGMVLWFESGGQAYLLLAEHADSQRGWAGFGGGEREGETVAQTAATKGHEESRGYYARADLLKRIEGQEPVMDGHFASYFAEVDFVPAQALTNHTPPGDAESDAYLERSTFAWIPYASIEDLLTEDIDYKKKYPVDPAYLPPGSETSWYWPIWLGNLRKAIAADAMPWDN